MQIDIDVYAQLIPNPITLITQLLATAVMVFLMYKLAWKPVKKILNARSEYEQSRLKKAEELKKETEELNAQANKKIEEASNEAQEIIAKAQTDGTRLKDNLVEEGKQKSQQLIDDAQRSIALQKNKMLEEMHTEVVDIALSAAEKMLQQKLDSQDDRDTIEDFIKEVSGK